MKEDICVFCNKEIFKEDKYVIIIGKKEMTKCHFRFHGDCWTQKRPTMTKPVTFILGGAL